MSEITLFLDGYAAGVITTFALDVIAPWWIFREPREDDPFEAQRKAAREK